MRIRELDECWLARWLGVDSGRLTELRHGPLANGQVADTFRLRHAIDGFSPKRTDRGDTVFTQMVNRGGRHALDLDLIGDLGSLAVS